MNTERIDQSALRTSSDEAEKMAPLYADLALAQGEVEIAEMDRRNTYFGSDYATLASIWRSCRKAITRHGFGVIQAPGVIEDEKGRVKVRVTTRLVHKSGQWVEATLDLDPVTISKKKKQGRGGFDQDDDGPPAVTGLAVRPTPQAIGGSITYARRYGLAAMAGVAPDADDDGESAEGRDGRDEPREDAGDHAPRDFDDLMTQLREAPSRARIDWIRNNSKHLTLTQAQQTEAGAVARSRWQDVAGGSARTAKLADDLERERTEPKLEDLFDNRSTVGPLAAPPPTAAPASPPLKLPADEKCEECQTSVRIKGRVVDKKHVRTATGVLCGACAERVDGEAS